MKRKKEIEREQQVGNRRSMKRLARSKVIRTKKRCKCADRDLNVKRRKQNNLSRVISLIIDLMKKLNLKQKYLARFW